MKTIQQYSHALFILLILGSGFITTSIVNAAPIINTPPLLPQDSDNVFFYEIGGGTNYRISGGVESPPEQFYQDYGLVLSTVGEFNPIASIKNTLNNLADQLKSKIVTIVQGYTQALGNLPGYALCRANPLLCQQFENYSIRAEEKTRKTVAFINNIESDIADARGNLEGWFKAGKAGRLVTAIKEAKAAGEDIEAVADRIREYSGKQGLKWLGGKLAGGDGQPPIRPIADTVKAGFNMLLNRPVTSGTAYVGDNPLGDYWDTPEEAAKWLVDVVGEFRPDINNKMTQKAGVIITGKDDGDGAKGGEDVIVDSAFVSKDVTTPALGLAPKIMKEQTLVLNQLSNLIVKKTPTNKDLTETMGKSSNIVITPRVLNLIKNSPVAGVLARQISQEAAQSNVLRYSLAARRMLLAGKNEPYIASYDIAQKQINEKIAALDANIESILFERKIAKELLSDTLGKMFAFSTRQVNDNSNNSPKPFIPRFGEGGVKTDQK